MSTASPQGFVIAGTHSGVGKTSVAVGLMAALHRRRLTVQPFKVGPDFIDPAHHHVASGRVSRNLDGWMLSHDANMQILREAAAGADACVVEGMMGLFDGIDGATEDGSTAQIAKWLGLPVVLVVDASALSRSAGAVVKGYAEFDPELNVAAVVYNHVGSETHLAWLTDATHVASSAIVLGGLPHSTDIVFPERQLGLAMPDHARTNGWINGMADLVEQHLDIDALLALAAPVATTTTTARSTPTARARIGVARDEAFCFYYQDNLDLLRHYGADLIEFSPLRQPPPSNLDGLYLGGGYPELFAAELAANAKTKEAVAALAAAGKPIYAECGGLMYLSSGIEDESGHRHAMCDVLPFWTQVTSMPTLGYAEVTANPGSYLPPAGVARGQAFHYSCIHPDTRAPVGASAYQAVVNAAPAVPEGFVMHTVVASYVHLHWRSNPTFARAFVDACAR